MSTQLWRDLRTFIALIVAAILFCSVPLNSYALSLSEEKKLGQKYLQIIKKHFRLIDDGEIIAYVNSVGHRITKHLNATPYQYHFYVIDDETHNAFAIPGGYIFLFRGLIAMMDNEAELASIICHEISHVQARHIERKMERAKVLNVASVAGMLAAAFLGLGGTAGQALTTGVLAGARSLQLKYSRSDEEEADRLGFRYLIAAGYDPQAMVTMMQKMYRNNWQMNSKVPSYLLTHPGMGERIGYVSLLVQKEKRKHPKQKYLPPIGDFPMMQAALISQYSELEVAQDRLRALLADKKKRAAALYGLGRLAMRENRTSEALTYLQKAAALRPQSPMILSSLGWAYYQQGQLDAARSSLQTALALDPRSSIVHYRLARVYRDMGALRQALKQLQQAEGLADVMPELDYELGVVYGRLNELGLAHYYLGQYYRQRKQMKLASFHYRKAQQLLPTNDPRLSDIDEALDEINHKKKDEKEDSFREKSYSPLTMFERIPE